jgi:hypothetical protein
LSERVWCKLQNGGLRGSTGRCQLSYGHGEEQVHTSCSGQQEDSAARPQVSHQGRSPSLSTWGTPPAGIDLPRFGARRGGSRCSDPLISYRRDFSQSGHAVGT